MTARRGEDVLAEPLNGAGCGFAEDNPRFSVIIPTFNRAHSLTRAINSVVRQDFDDWELIVIDDASTDDTPELLAQFSSDNRIRMLRNWSNIERSASRNRGIRASRGAFTCFLDSDDYYLPNHLSALHDKIVSAGQEVFFLYTLTHVVATGERTVVQQDRPPEPGSLLDRLVEISSNSVCVARPLLIGLDGYDERIRNMEDTELLLRIAERCEFVRIPEYTCVTERPPDLYWRTSRTRRELRARLETLSMRDTAIATSPLLPRGFRRHTKSKTHLTLASTFEPAGADRLRAIWHAAVAAVLSPFGSGRDAVSRIARSLRLRETGTAVPRGDP